jgi:hypothetical protein
MFQLAISQGEGNSLNKLLVGNEQQVEEKSKNSEEWSKFKEKIEEGQLKNKNLQSPVFCKSKGKNSVFNFKLKAAHSGRPENKRCIFKTDHQNPFKLGKRIRNQYLTDLSYEQKNNLLNTNLLAPENIGYKEFDPTKGRIFILEDNKQGRREALEMLNWFCKNDVGNKAIVTRRKMKNTFEKVKNSKKYSRLLNFDIIIVVARNAPSKSQYRISSNSRNINWNFNPSSNGPSQKSQEIDQKASETVKEEEKTSEKIEETGKDEKSVESEVEQTGRDVENPDVSTKREEKETEQVTEDVEKLEHEISLLTDKLKKQEESLKELENAVRSEIEENREKIKAMREHIEDLETLLDKAFSSDKQPDGEELSTGILEKTKAIIEIGADLFSQMDAVSRQLVKISEGVELEEEELEELAEEIDYEDKIIAELDSEIKKSAKDAYQDREIKEKKFSEKLSKEEKKAFKEALEENRMIDIEIEQGKQIVLNIEKEAKAYLEELNELEEVIPALEDIAQKIERLSRIGFMGMQQEFRNASQRLLEFIKEAKQHLDQEEKNLERTQNITREAENIENQTENVKNTLDRDTSQLKDKIKSTSETVKRETGNKTKNKSNKENSALIYIAGAIVAAVILLFLI